MVSKDGSILTMPATGDMTMIYNKWIGYHETIELQAMSDASNARLRRKMLARFTTGCQRLGMTGLSVN
jgi:hypothetical protein